MAAHSSATAYVVDREACIMLHQNPCQLPPIVTGGKFQLYIPSCIKKKIRNIDPALLKSLENSLGIKCYEENIEFFLACGALRDSSNAFNASRLHFEEEKLHVIAVARILECSIISADRSTSASALSNISNRFGVQVHVI